MSGDSKKTATALCCCDKRCSVVERQLETKKVPMQAVAGEMSRTVPSKFLQAVDKAVVG
jgi:hypothetical protein